MTRVAPPASCPHGVVPGGHPVFGHYDELQKDPFGLLGRSVEEHGELLRFRFLGPFEWVFAASPATLDDVLNRQGTTAWRKGTFARVLALVLGPSLQSTDGPDAVRQRRALAACFVESSLRRWAAIVDEEAVAEVARWCDPARAGVPFDLAATIERLCLVTGCRVFLGAHPGSDVTGLHDDIEQTVEYLHYRLLHPFSPPRWVPTARNRAYANARRRVTGTLARVRARRAGHDDLLTMLERDRDRPDGLKGDEAFLNACSFVIANGQTLAATVLWSALAVALHPDAESRLRDEARATSAPEALDRATKLVFTRMVVQESMRLYPAAPWAGRTATRSLDLGGVKVRKGTILMFSPYVTQRLSRYWPDPGRFDPERFAPANLASHTRNAFLAFGAGTRQCIAQQYTTVHVQLVLAAIFRRVRLRPLGQAPLAQELRGALKPARPIPVVAEMVEAP